MQTELLKRIIRDQRESFENHLSAIKLIEREMLDYAKKFLRAPNILAVLGPRRAGKSVFAFLVAKSLKENFGYINFDDERLLNFTTDDFDKILEIFYEFYGENSILILDEIQNVKKWEMFTSRIRTNRKIVITGSNSKLLSGELSTYLTGRHSDIILFPFSFREFLGYKPDIYLTKDIAKIRNIMDKYIKGSGFPEYKIFGSEMVSVIYKDIINKDCIYRYDIRDKVSFRELAKYLISNIAAEFTYSNLCKYFAINDSHTVKNYIEYLKDAFLVIVLNRFSKKLKEQIIAPKKIYATDQGLYNCIGFSLSDMKGKLLENLICVELMRKKSADIDKEIYYWKDHQHREVDFVVKERDKIKELIQVAYSVDAFSEQRELNSLMKASDELQCNNLLVITWEQEGEKTINGKKISLTPVWKWMLT